MPEAGGLRSVLSASRAYQLFFDLVGGAERNRALVRDFIRPRPGDRILDIGCGPASIVPFLPEVDYVGVDLNSDYIHRARSRYPDKQFVCERVSSFSLSGSEPFDIVLALGILHHLDDVEASSLFSIAAQALRTAGRLITVDGVWADGQSPIARYLLSRDRGQFVRKVAEYQKLGAGHFAQMQAQVRHDLLRIPYSLVILECGRA